MVYHSGYLAVPSGFGVLTFFVISGFLITHLLLRENETTGHISFRDFYIRRSLRIFPPFYAYWFLAVSLLLLRHAHIIWPQAICSLFYVANYYQGLHNYPSSLFSHTWSLGVEEQFYLLWPAAFALFRTRLATFARVLLFLVPALWVLRSVLYLRAVPEPYLYTSFETRCDAILVGALFSILIHLNAAPRLMAQLRRPIFLPLTIAALAATLLGEGQLGFGFRYVFAYAVQPILIMCFILQLINARSMDWMEVRPLVYLGTISYSTYLYQQLVIPFVSKALHSRPRPVVSFACLLVTWAVATLSHYCVEKPFLRLKQRFTAREVRADR